MPLTQVCLVLPGWPGIAGVPLVSVGLQPFGYVPICDGEEDIPAVQGALICWGLFWKEAA
jgi:hypothetical protein